MPRGQSRLTDWGAINYRQEGIFETSGKGSPARYTPYPTIHNRAKGIQMPLMTPLWGLIWISSQVLSGPIQGVPEPAPDPFRLREALALKDNPVVQAQAALALVRHPDREAAIIVKKGLEQVEEENAFIALAHAVAIEKDPRFREELYKAMAAGKANVRQAAAEAVSAQMEPAVVDKMRDFLLDPRVPEPTRMLAAWALGRSLRKAAFEPLLAALQDRQPSEMRQSIAQALEQLTGQELGTDPGRWQQWWEKHKSETNERWLEQRLAYQSSRIQRLEGDLESARGQTLRLHQQLYARLTPAERMALLPSLVEQNDPAIRSQAATWCQEALVGADPSQAKTLADMLLRLSKDSDPTVSRSGALGLGRLADARARERLAELVRSPVLGIRTAAVRGLAQQARLPINQEEATRRFILNPIIMALDDPSIEVVVEAAEDLGTLGLPEAVPVLGRLLAHPQEAVRKISAQALERVADLSVIEPILRAMDDPLPLVRFSLVGAMAQILGTVKDIPPTDQLRLQARLEVVLLRDGDPGVRARAATALGEVGGPALLAILWRAVSTSDDSRVQDKAWAAMLEILGKSADPTKVLEWDRTLAEGGLTQRRLALLVEMANRWQKRTDAKTLMDPLREPLIATALSLGKWQTALGPLRELLSTQAAEQLTQTRLRQWLIACSQAIADGNGAEAIKLLREVEPLLGKDTPLGRQAEELAKKAKGPG